MIHKPTATMRGSAQTSHPPDDRTLAQRARALLRLRTAQIWRRTEERAGTRGADAEAEAEADAGQVLDAVANCHSGPTATPP